MTPEQQQKARDRAQQIIIESCQAAGYPDSTEMDVAFKHHLTDRFAAALVEARPQRTEGDSYRQGMHHAALLCRNEFKRSPEAARDHDSVYMSGYEDACDHLSIVIEQAAVIDCVPALVEAGGVQGCVWTFDDDGVYWTSCDNAHQFTEGGPAENKHRYCPYCSKQLVEHPTGRRSDDESLQELRMSAAEAW